jgi:enoyl-CoA hydratase/carnithine racemase
MNAATEPQQRLVEYTTENAVAVITLNRPEKLNALTVALSLELRAAVEKADRDPDVRACVLRGAGRAFCTGTDVKERQNGPNRHLPPGMDGGLSSSDILIKLANWKPVVAAVHGYVLGGGITLAMSSEIIVAAEATRFQITETPRGTAIGGLWAAIRQRTGDAFANDVCLTGRFWDAEESLRYNLVNRVVPESDLLPTAMDIARAIASHPPLPVQDLVRMRRNEIEAVRIDVRSRTSQNFRATKDFAEAASAFVEKRSPSEFSGILRRAKSCPRAT